MEFKVHSAQVTNVAYSPDGKYVLSAGGSGDSRMILRDALTWKEVHRFPLEGDNAWIADVAFSPDSKHFATAGGRNGLVRVWSTKSCRQVGEMLAEGEYVSDVCFSPDGRRIVACGHEATVGFQPPKRDKGGWMRVYDAASFKQLHLIYSYERAMDAIGYLPDSKRLLSRGDDHALRFWNADTMTELHVFRDGANWIQDFIVSPDGKQVAAGCYDKTLCVWDLAEKTVVRRFPLHGRRLVAFTPDGSRILTIGSDARLLDAVKGRTLERYEGCEELIQCAAIAADGREALIGASDGSLHVWRFSR
jgi:WD40 repeat protein